MNAIKRFLIKKLFKMDKFQLALLVAAHYNSLELKGKDIERANAVNFEVDRLTDEFIESFPKEVKLDKVDKTFVPPAPPKPELPSKPATALDTKGATKAPDVVEKKKDDKVPEESTVLIKPYYDCSIVQNKGKEAKRIKFDESPIKLIAFKNDGDAKQFNNVYPTVELLEFALEEAWDMACKGSPNSQINAKLKELIGSYYASSVLKTTDDYYKISNAYSKLTKIIRRGFGEGYEDFRVSVTRPSYTLLTESGDSICLFKDKDCSVVAVEDKPVVEKTETKPELKDIQTQKKVEPKEEQKSKEEPAGVDEEQQETGNIPETGVAPTTENAPVAEETPNPEAETSPEESSEPEVEGGKAPSVNSFDSFNDIETLIYDKLKAGNLKASKEKDPKVQMAIKAEAREDAKLLIQSRFDSEEWAVKDEKGFWKLEFLKYWNAIVKEIGTRANVK